ncbi:LysR family transcriptional regulator [Paraburkholderia silvatlantica]|uniref:DNA-binding transcriptional LysR family regulator n=1 Tax=Paraburkholderia silvatlantica TaxID=321895 RepID=A0A2U1ALU9_9BURK|nr:LysR family transcriptional regulator [Paraburkholderia silvatlantica]MBB2926984.1 DNA-binding transcriptional LysR family regulator [Paraburkholderia silvatlantica]PVY37393.1 DNA-binding transcriptional LysR family regulator [Paraburkholderia silvatlantica]PXW42355.1 DNA-binding transcriptional LysR family regulator [Paraburkholderia silvatlantica]PYE25040.1 DNA-binding transcriptional LysR family regulator [Paraburkholderia silvatlantica]TDR05234.1 DNA-binding transcriptional LysR family 
MDSGDLIYFTAVARMGSITKAALFLDTVQSNVTQRIRRLEEELSVSLFHRHGRGVTLTPAGAQLLPYASQIDHMMAEAKRSIASNSVPGGVLRIGSMETTAAVRLPEVLVEYATEFPRVDISFGTGTSQSLILDVLERRLEAALVCAPVDHIDLLAESILCEELVVVTAPWIRHSRDGCRPAWAEFRGDAKIAIFRHGCAYRERLERLLIRRGITSIRRMELGTLDGLLGCVRAGIAISLLPRSVVAPLAKDGKLAVHALTDDEGQAQTLLVRRRDVAVSLALNCFVEKLRACFRSTDDNIGQQDGQAEVTSTP